MLQQCNTAQQKSWIVNYSWVFYEILREKKVATTKAPSVPWCKPSLTAPPSSDVPTKPSSSAQRHLLIVQAYIVGVLKRSGEEDKTDLKIADSCDASKYEHIATETPQGLEKDRVSKSGGKRWDKGGENAVTRPWDTERASRPSDRSRTCGTKLSSNFGQMLLYICTDVKAAIMQTRFLKAKLRERQICWVDALSFGFYVI